MARVAGAPISWGICEVPGWGAQLPVDRVLSEMRDLGLTTTELGAIGWLPTDPDELRAGARRPRAARRRAPSSRSSATIPARKAEALGVGRADGDAARRRSAPTPSSPPWSAIPDDWARPEVSEAGWAHLFAMLDEIEAITTDHGLRQVLHPHVNTLVETADELDRLLESSPVAICLDTGHLTIGGADPVDIAGRVRRPRRPGAPEGRADRRSPTGCNAGELELMAAVQDGLFASLGEGDVPIADVITSLEQQGYAACTCSNRTWPSPPANRRPVRAPFATSPRASRSSGHSTPP